MKKEFKLKQGDLLFQNSGRSEIATAIKDVTATSFSKNYSHVGMAIQKNGKWFVLEAPKGRVVKTPINKFLNRNKKQIQQITDYCRKIK